MDAISSSLGAKRGRMGITTHQTSTSEKDRNAFGGTLLASWILALRRWFDLKNAHAQSKKR
jgi:hypothetical protein